MHKICSGCLQNLPVQAFHKGNSLLGRKSKCISCCKSHYDPIKAREARRAHQRRNREEYRRRNSEYDRAHRSERAAREAFRRAQKLNATPPWLTREQKAAIQSLYIERDRLKLEKGIMYHVDHVVPLISDVVCGLHVPWNLQVIPAIDNLRKRNKV